MVLHGLVYLGSIIGAIAPDKRPDAEEATDPVTVSRPAADRASPASDAPAPRGVRLSSESTAGVFDRQFSAALAPSIDVRAGTFELLLGAKVRSGVDGVRKREWDEASDFTHIMRHFRARGSIGEVEVGLRGGELPALTYGHGALVRDYNNNLDFDHGRAAMAAVVQGPGFQTEALVDDFLAPHLVLGRAATQVLDGHLRLGISGGADVSAPGQLVTDPDGRRVLDATTLAPAANSQPMGLVAVDVEVALGDPQQLEAAPYVEVVNLLGFGSGAHVGGRLRKDFRGGRVDALAEWRFQTDDYLPGYIDLSYDIERIQSLSPGLAQLTKRAELAAARGNVNGFRFEAGVRSRWVDLRGGVEDRPGQPRGYGRLGLPLLGERVRLSGLFAYQGEAIAAGELRVAVSKHSYVVSDYTRRLSAGDDGYYRAFWAASVGFGLTIGQ
jgi:hypothetical protein